MRVYVSITEAEKGGMEITHINFALCLIAFLWLTAGLNEKTIKLINNSSVFSHAVNRKIALDLA